MGEYKLNSIEDAIKDFKEGDYLFMATKKGLVKKTPILDYANVRKTGLAAITLREDDELIEVKITDDERDVILVTQYGQCIRFHESDVRSTGRTSMGVRGMNLSDRDGKGVKCYKITEKTGNVVGAKAVGPDDEIMIINTDGIVIRMECAGISVLGRITSGVKLINLKEHEEVASIAKVRRASGELEENAEETAEEANTEATAETVVEEQTEE